MVAGECSIIAGVIVTCILAVLSGLCLVLALIFFVYARRKMEHVTFVEKSPHGRKAKQRLGDSSGGIVNTAYLADDLNMQEAGSSDHLDGNFPFGNKSGIPSYVVCKEFIPNGQEKWSKGLVQDKLVYRLMAGDINFEARPQESDGDDGKSPFYLAFSGVKESSPNSGIVGGANKLLKSGDRIHALLLNCSVLAQNGQLDENMAQLLLKILQLIDEQPAAFVDVISSSPHERLIDGGDTVDNSNNKVAKEEEAAANGTAAEMRQAELSTSESKDSGREDAQTNSEREPHNNNDEASSGACSGDDGSPQQKKPGGSSFIARSRHSRRSHGSSSTDQAFQSTEGSESNHPAKDDIAVINVDELTISLPYYNTKQEETMTSSGEAIEMTAQHPAFLAVNGGGHQLLSSLPLPGPDLLRSPPGDDVVVIDTTSSSSSSLSSSDDDEKIIGPTSPHNNTRLHLNNGSTQHDISSSTSTTTTNNTKIDTYMAL